MLTDEQIEAFGEVLVPYYQQLEQTIIADIARRVAKEMRWTETAELQAEYLRELGWSPYKIRIEVIRMLNANAEYIAMIDRNTLEEKAAVQEAINVAKEAIREVNPVLFEEIGNMAFNNDLSTWAQAGKALWRSPNIDTLIKAMAKRTEGDLLNLTKTLAFRTASGATIPARRAFSYAMNKALTEVTSGGLSYREACTRAVRELAKSGLRYVDYESGVVRQLDTAAMNCIRTASAQLTGEIMQENIENNDVDMVQVSAHWGARPSHEAWQGQIYTVAEFKLVCGYGDPSNADHIYSYNCRHHHYPFWPGISEPIEYPPEPGPFDINGKKYTYYEATQRQRKMERDIRAMKREALAAEQMGDTDVQRGLALNISDKTKEYKSFSAACGIRAKAERVSVLGYDRGVSYEMQGLARLERFNRAIVISNPKRAHKAERVEYVRNLHNKTTSLSEGDRILLSKIPNVYDWLQIPTEQADIYTLAALTAETGDEFAMFSKGDTKIIIHGTNPVGKGWSLPRELSDRIYKEQLRWSAHSHPTTVNLSASTEDRNTLSHFTWQKSSIVVDLKGNTEKFSSNIFEDLL